MARSRIILYSDETAIHQNFLYLPRNSSQINQRETIAECPFQKQVIFLIKNLSVWFTRTRSSYSYAAFFRIKDVIHLQMLCKVSHIIELDMKMFM